MTCVHASSLSLFEVHYRRSKPRERRKNRPSRLTRRSPRPPPAMASPALVGLRKFRFFAEEPTDVVVPHSVSASAAADGVIWLGCEDGRRGGGPRTLSGRGAARLGRRQHLEPAPNWRLFLHSLPPQRGWLGGPLAGHARLVPGAPGPRAPGRRRAGGPAGGRPRGPPPASASATPLPIISYPRRPRASC